MGALTVEQRATTALKSGVPSTIVRSMADHAQLAPISIEQYHEMLKHGVLREGAPIELLNGMLVWKNRATAGEDPMTIGKPHTVACTNLILLNAQLIPLNAHLRSQNPVTLPTAHEPEPDGVIVAGRDPKRYLAHHPEPADIYCIIEVSDSSLDYDRGDKLQAYAEAAIRQYVIVNLIAMQVEVYEQPAPGEHRFASLKVSNPGQKVRLSLGNDKSLEVEAEQLLP